MWRSNGSGTGINSTSGRSTKAGRFPDVPEPDPSEVARIPRDVLMEFVGELPDGYRTVFNLYCIEGIRTAISRRCWGSTKKSSSSQLFRARTLLARRIAAYMETH